MRIATEVASALDYAHRRGVIHRDIKPENILLHDGQSLVADFGIALAAAKTGGTRMTETGMSLGTPTYMSPEQAMGERSLDARTDIYALGCVLYEMLAGEPPFTGPTAQAIVAKVMTSEPEPVKALRKTVPDHVTEAVHAALQKLPADRFSSAAEFAQALQLSAAARPARTAARPSPHERVRLTNRLALGVTLAAALAASIGWWVAAHREESESTVRFTLDFPSAFRVGNFSLGAGSPLAVSPDGATIALIGAGSGSSQHLAVRKLSELEHRDLPGTEGAYSPFFSPDGKWIAFFAGQQLKKIPVDGGSVVPISEPLSGPVYLYGATWGPNDRIVLAGNGLSLLSAAGGPARTIVALADIAPARVARWPRFLADGKTVLFTLWTGSLSGSRIAAASIETGKVTMLDVPGSFPLGVMDGQLIYTGSTFGTLMAVPFDARGLRVTDAPQQVVDRIVVRNSGAAHADLSASGTLVYESGASADQVLLADARGATRVMIGEPRRYSYPRFSPEGSRVAVGIASGSSTDIWIYDVASRTPTRLTTEGTINDRPEWTPDGKRVLFRTDRSGTGFSLWWQPTDGSERAEVLLRLPGRDVWEGVFTPDARSLVYRTGTVGPSDIWVRALDGDTLPKPIAATSFAESSARVSPDGRWVAYSSDESSAVQVYVRSLAGSAARTQVSVDGGDSPVWSRDGRRIYYVNGQQVVAANVVTTGVFSVASRDTLFSGEFTLLPGHASFDVSPDGRELLLVRPIDSEASTVVVHNWRAQLRAAAARTNP